MPNKVFVQSNELARILNIYRPRAVKIILKYNEELKAQGYYVIPDRIPISYLEKKIFGFKYDDEYGKERTI